MNRDLSYHGRPLSRHRPNICSFNDDTSKMAKAISFGFMAGSAIASPVLFELQNYWLFDFFVFLLSLATFVLQYQQEIQIFGPYTLVAVTLLGLAAYSSARTPLEELVPWLPTAICLSVLLTVYFLPKLRQSPNRDNEIQIAMEEGRPQEYYGIPVEAGLVWSSEDIPNRQQSFEMAHRLNHDTAHTGGLGRPGSQHSSGPSSRDSDIALEDTEALARIVARMVSPSRPGYSIGNLPQTFSDSGLPSQGFAAAGPSCQWDLVRDSRRRSSSPESNVVDSSSSNAAKSDTELLG